MKLIAFIKKHREGLSYMAFGVLTTFSSMAVYELTFLFAKHFCGVDLAEVSSGPYLATYFTAQVLQWVTAVLVAFSTNRKWVFTKADRSKGTFWPQLFKFSLTRLGTFILDLIMTYLLVLLLNVILKGAEFNFELFRREWAINAELIAKLLSSIIVVILNYFISKGIVFKKKKEPVPESEYAPADEETQTSEPAAEKPADPEDSDGQTPDA
ncbi:MAG: GtrA family protein [Clostridia bacterium]|nr:GtrA family protein [Clostridia bacterium]